MPQVLTKHWLAALVRMDAYRDRMLARGGYDPMGHGTPPGRNDRQIEQGLDDYHLTWLDGHSQWACHIDWWR